MRNNCLGDSHLVKTTRPSENASKSETTEYLTILSENSWSAGKVPEQLVKKMSCSTAGRNETLGLHAYKFNCTAGAFCRAINEGVDGPDSMLQSSFGVRVGEGLRSLGFAADDCSGDKEDIIRRNNHKLRQDKAIINR